MKWLCLENFLHPKSNTVFIFAFWHQEVDPTFFCAKFFLYWVYYVKFLKLKFLEEKWILRPTYWSMNSKGEVFLLVLLRAIRIHFVNQVWVSVRRWACLFTFFAMVYFLKFFLSSHAKVTPAKFWSSPNFTFMMIAIFWIWKFPRFLNQKNHPLSWNRPDLL